MAESEYHVASYVVSCRAQDGTAVAATIEAMPGLEVHVEEKGKLVVTAEAADVKELADMTAQLEAIRSVIAVAPVYHEFEDEPPEHAPGET